MTTYKITAEIRSEFAFTIEADSEEEARGALMGVYPQSKYSGGETCLVGIHSFDVGDECKEVEVTDEGELEVTDIEETEDYF